MSTTQTMIEAIKAGNLLQVNTLLDANPALVDTRDETGVSALLLAVYYGRQDIQELLLAREAEVTIFEAAATGQPKRVMALLETEPALVNAYSSDGFTPLHLASFFGHPEIVELLLDAGAEPNALAKNPMQVRPLHSAVAHHQPEVAFDMAKTLLAHRAEVNVTQAGGWTPLHQAAQHGQVDLVKLLLASGAEIDTKSEDGRTPLQLALQHGQHEVVELLRQVEAGMSVVSDRRG